MKELERWWRWFDGEKPEIGRAVALLWRRCAEHERDAMRTAAGFIECRYKGQRMSFVNATVGDETLREALTHNPDALREFAFELARSFERLQEQVSRRAAPPKAFSEGFLRTMYGGRQAGKTAAGWAYITGELEPDLDNLIKGLWDATQKTKVPSPKP